MFKSPPEGRYLEPFCPGLFLRPDPTRLDAWYEPTISFGIPAKNEETNIKETILRIAATDGSSTLNRGEGHLQRK
jgi:hypothetical protein